MLWLPNSIEKSLPHHEMIFVKGGSFLMGSDEEDARDNEKPIRQLQLSDFYLAKYPVTQALWKAVMGNKPIGLIDDSRPVVLVSWEDLHAFIRQLNNLAGSTYRLPTEAEWEYAARGGQDGKGYKYAGSNKLKEVAWCRENSHDQIKPVGLKYPNELGLYDMNGNVWEWCSDWYNEDSSASHTTPQEFLNGPNRVRRGGSWSSFQKDCRPSTRLRVHPDRQFSDFGFRLAATPPPER